MEGRETYAIRHLDQETDTSTLHARIRDMLTHGGWYTSEELVRHVGHRFAAALHMVRYGLDGKPPMDIIAQRTPGSHMYRYKWSGTYHEPESRPRCDKCGHLLKKRRR